MLKTVFEIHRMGILHQDIKPENFVVGKNDQIYLIDFGISRLWVENLNSMKHIKQK